MELGELLYNKSEYIETVCGVHISALPFSGLGPSGACAPILSLPHLGFLWHVWACIGLALFIP